MTLEHRNGPSPERLERSQRKIMEQHANLDGLEIIVKRAVHAGDTAGVESALQGFAGALEAHFDLEERAYYPGAATLDANLTEVFAALEEDHVALREGLASLRPTLRNEGIDAFDPAFDAFSASLAEHESREEKAMASIADLR